MAEQFPPVASLVPHRDTMLLLSEVVSESVDQMVASAAIGADHPFLIPGRGVPAYVGLEIMAQAICAKVGLDQWKEGTPPQIGFLLGCQRYKTYRDWIAVGETVTAHVVCRLDADELGSFDCELRDAGDDVLATGGISVFRPKNVEGFLNESETPT